MIDASGATAPAYNERCQTRASAITRWMLLVPGCALPVGFAYGDADSVGELAGLAAAVATWIGVMIRLHVWRLTEGDYGGTSRLTESAAVFMALQWLAWALAPREALLAFYAPAVISAALLVLKHLELPDAVAVFVLTVACGGQVLACVLALSWASGRLVRHLNRQR
jgi:hypothetical protein